MMDKKLIKDGMVVETRNKQKHILIRHKLWSEDGFIWFNHDDKLKDIYTKEDNNEQWDIVNVFKFDTIPLALNQFLNGTNNSSDEFLKEWKELIERGMLENLWLIYEE